MGVFKYWSARVKKRAWSSGFRGIKQPNQPEISGFYCVNGNELRVVATDRYRLAEKK